MISPIKEIELRLPVLDRLLRIVAIRYPLIAYGFHDDVNDDYILNDDEV